MSNEYVVILLFAIIEVGERRRGFCVATSIMPRRRTKKEKEGPWNEISFRVWIATWNATTASVWRPSSHTRAARGRNVSTNQNDTARRTNTTPTRIITILTIRTWILVQKMAVPWNTTTRSLSKIMISLWCVQHGHNNFEQQDPIARVI